MDDGFFKCSNQPTANSILFGVLGEENPKHPGTYRFKSTDGFCPPDAHLLFPDADVDGGGQYSKPKAGSPCVCIVTKNGAQAFIAGFQKPPLFDEDGESDEPVVGDAEDIATSGDKVWQTKEGAKFILRRAGMVIVEGGPGVSIFMTPVKNQMTLRSTNFTHIVNGYKARRGRVEIGTNPATTHEEEYWNQVGASYQSIGLRHGALENNARRELTLTEVVVAGGQTAVVTKTRETYYNDGSWVGEGPKYQWGGVGANEPMVLGNQLVAAFNTLVDIVKSLKVNTAWGPSTPPIPPTPIDLQKLKNELSGKILSTFLFLSKNPAPLG